MKKEFNERYQQVYQLAEQQGEAFAEVVFESFDDLDAHSIKESIQEKIEYKFIVQRYDKDRLDEIVDLMVETLCSKREYITVAGDDYPASLVKERLQRIDSTHIEYVFECLDKNTTFMDCILSPKKPTHNRLFAATLICVRNISITAR